MEQKSNKMATMPVNRLMLTMGLPIVLSMALQAVYNIVDSAFVSNMHEGGEQALNALTLAFPVQMLMVAVAVGTGVGTNALMARNLGSGDRKNASRVAGNAMFLGTVIYLVFLLFGIFGVRGYIETQTSNQKIMTMAVDYLSICCVFSIGIVFFTILEKVIQSTGRSMYSTIAQISGAVTNIILDPIMIYGLLGCPEWGVKGAAYATVIGQIVSALLALFFHLKYDREIDNAWKYKAPSGEIIRNIYAIGFPAIIAQALMSFMTYALNVIFVAIGEDVVTAYGLYYKIQQFILFAAFGLRDAITPIVSFSHGMGDRKRIRAGVKYGMLYTLSIMTFGLILIEAFAQPFSSLFGLSGQTQSLCISAMRIVSLSFLFAGANIAYQGIFQALDGGLESLIISVCRQFLFVIPLAWGFSRLAAGNPDLTWLIWTTFPIAEGVTALIAFVLMKKIWKKLEKELAAVHCDETGREMEEEKAV